MPNVERQVVVLQKRERYLSYLRGFCFEEIFTKALQLLIIIVGLLFSMLVLRALIRGVHSDTYFSPIWIYQSSQY
jgi:hypothetical protein